MKKILGFILFIIISNICISQNLTLTELENTMGSELNELDIKLTSKNWFQLGATPNSMNNTHYIEYEWVHLTTDPEKSLEYRLNYLIFDDCTIGYMVFYTTTDNS